MLMSFKAQKLPSAFATESFIRIFVLRSIALDTSRDPNLNLIFKHVGIELSRRERKNVAIPSSDFSLCPLFCGLLSAYSEQRAR